VTAYIVDAGPLIAVIDRRDQHHAWARGLFGSGPGMLLTCEPVIAEAAHILRRYPRGAHALLARVAEGVLEIPFRLTDHAAEVADLMRKYADRPMSLADACLVQMSAQHGDAKVVTTDRHFRVYRRPGRRTVPTIMPPTRR
jgi:predicted nucleic acid-binding protein